MSVIRVTWKAPGAQHKVTIVRYRDAHFDTKFKALVDFTFADTLDLRRMNAVDFLLIVSLVAQNTACGVQFKLNIQLNIDGLFR